MSEEVAVYDTRAQIERALPAKDALQRATQIAEVLAPVIEKRHLYAQIGNKRHVLFEGWTTLGALCGALLGETVSAIVAWTRPIENGFEARVEAVTYSGRVVGAAEAQCTRAEKRWADADDYAIRSMAQTRAGSKAMRMPLGWIMQLSGFEATPAEEMDGVQTRPQQQRPAPASRQGHPGPPLRGPQPTGDALPKASDMKTAGHVLNAALEHFRLKRDQVFAIEGAKGCIQRGEFGEAWAAIVFSQTPDVRPDEPEAEAGEELRTPLEDELPLE